jgi:hypothetical protein
MQTVSCPRASSYSGSSTYRAGGGERWENHAALAEPLTYLPTKSEEHPSQKTEKASTSAVVLIGATAGTVAASIFVAVAFVAMKRKLQSRATNVLVVQHATASV